MPVKHSVLNVKGVALIVNLLTSNRFLVSIVLVECESLQSVTIITIDTHVDTSLDCTRAENVDIVVSSSSTHLTGKNVIKHQMHDLQETLMVLVSTWFFYCFMYSFPGFARQWI